MANGDQSSDTLKEAYKGFLEALETIVEQWAGNIPKAKEFSESVFDGLKGEEACCLVVEALNEQHEAVKSAFKVELEFFNAKYTDDNLRGLLQSSGVALAKKREFVERALEDGDTVKKSLEELVGSTLPGWLKKMLKLLNELLKLVRP